MPLPKEELSQREIKCLRGVFDQLDDSGDGHISHDELYRLFDLIGHRPSDADIQDLIRQCDTDGTGTIDFQEFCTAMVNMSETERLFILMAAVFKSMDTDGSGTLDKDEMRNVLGEAGLGDDIPEDQLDQLMKSMDTSGDGKVDFQEFMTTILDVLLHEGQ